MPTAEALVDGSHLLRQDSDRGCHKSWTSACVDRTELPGLERSLSFVSVWMFVIEKRVHTRSVESSVLCLVWPSVDGLATSTTSTATNTTISSWHGLRMTIVIRIVRTCGSCMDDIFGLVVGSDLNAGL